MGKSQQDIAQLARSVVEIEQTFSQAYEHQWGFLEVVMCALAALVRSHPDPEAFATAFRRAWQQREVNFSCDDENPARQAGLEPMLSVLESNCPVRLGVRPPGRAAEPEC